MIHVLQKKKIPSAYFVPEEEEHSNKQMILDGHMFFVVEMLQVKQEWRQTVSYQLDYYQKNRKESNVVYVIGNKVYVYDVHI